MTNLNDMDPKRKGVTRRHWNLSITWCSWFAQHAYQSELRWDRKRSGEMYVRGLWRVSGKNIMKLFWKQPHCLHSHPVGARSPTFCQKHSVVPYIVYANSKKIGMASRMPRLTWAFAVYLCGKHLTSNKHVRSLQLQDWMENTILIFIF